MSQTKTKRKFPLLIETELIDAFVHKCQNEGKTAAGQLRLFIKKELGLSA